ncbi:MAG TPA: isoprenylcysteine carboxylmethyltransferase family protein [Candidatus Saccharimonadales bacterium]|nr:isoprenylcysteine carboxylmethyltransferase family protein [Candidatus Saccharimonadales bacterium]
MSYSRWASRIRVPAGFLFAAVYLIAAEPRPRILLIGCGVAMIGLLVRAYAAGVIEKNARLAVSGPYAHTRNPLYLGTAIAALGLSIAAGKLWLFVFAAAFFVAVYLPVIRREQVRLEELFGIEYKEYSAVVPLLLPRFTAWQSPLSITNRFTWRRYRSNHEYRAAGAFIFITGFLICKMLWSAK